MADGNERLCEGMRHFVKFLNGVRDPFDKTPATVKVSKIDHKFGGSVEKFLCALCLADLQNNSELSGGGIGLVESLVG